MLITTDAVGGVWTYALTLARGLVARGAPVVLAVVGPPASAAQVQAADGIRVVQTGLPLDWMAPDLGALEHTAQRLAALAALVGAGSVHLHAPALVGSAVWPVPVVAVTHSCVATWWDAVRGGPPPPDLAWRIAATAAGLRGAACVIAPTLAHAAATTALYGRLRIAVVHNGSDAVPHTEAYSSRSALAASVDRQGVRAVPVDTPGAGGPGRTAGARPNEGENASLATNSRPPLRIDPVEARGPKAGSLNTVSANDAGYEPGAVREPVVLTAGRLWDEGKGVAWLDRAVPGLGMPVQAAGPVQGPSGGMAAFPNLTLLGTLDTASMAQAYADASVYASMAIYEPFGLAVLEAAQAGCALVLRDIPSARELWDGAAVFVADEAGLVPALRSALLYSPALGARARERAARYTTGAMVDGTLALHRALHRALAG